MPETRISTAVLTEKPSSHPTHAWPLVIEMSPSEIPATAPVDLEKFLAGDSDVCQVIAKVPEGWSYNGWYFTPQAIQDIANTIATSGITGGLGHIKDEMDFGEVAVVWVGATYRPDVGAMFARGYVNPERPDLKRLIRSGVINRVSTDGYAEFEDPTDGRSITTFNVITLDLVPRLRNGTESGIAAKDMIKDKDPTTDSKEVREEQMNEENKLPENEQEQTEATPTPPATDESAVGEKAPATEEAVDELKELKDLLAPLGENPKERLAKLMALEQQVKQEKAEAVLSKAIADMVHGEDARTLVKLMLKPETGETQEAAQGRVKSCLENAELKRILTDRFKEITPKGSAAKNDKPQLTWEN